MGEWCSDCGGWGAVEGVLGERRTFGRSDVRTFGPMVRRKRVRSADNEGGARKRRAPATTKMAGDCEGASRVPTSKHPSCSFRAFALSASQLARVARELRVNGHTAIAGGRCLDAGFMPPPSSRSITRSSLRIPTSLPLPAIRFADLADWRTGGLADWRTGGLADWRTGGLADWRTARDAALPHIWRSPKK